jgi:ABC-type Fe3+ transport system substrate-binding protein
MMQRWADYLDSLKAGAQSTQNPLSSVSETRQASTLREHQPTIPRFVTGVDVVFKRFAFRLAGQCDFRVGRGVGDGAIAFGHDAILDDEGGRLAAFGGRDSRSAHCAPAIISVSVRRN